jgi:hypothetical protein
MHYVAKYYCVSLYTSPVASTHCMHTYVYCVPVSKSSSIPVYRNLTQVGVSVIYFDCLICDATRLEYLYYLVRVM